MIYLLLLSVLVLGDFRDTLYPELQEKIKAGKKEEALQTALEYLKEESDPKYYRDVAGFLRSRGAREESYRLLEEGRKRLKNPHLFGREFYLKYYQGRDFEKALVELVNLLREEGKVGWVRREAGRLERFLGDKKTEKLLKKLQREKPPEKKINYLLADLYLRRGNLEKAALSLERAGERKGLLPLARQAIETGEADLALRILDKIKEKDRRGEWFYLQGIALEEKGDLEGAKSSLESATEKGQREAREVLFDLLLYRLREPEEVLKLTEKDSLNPYRLKAYVALGNFEEAKRMARRGAMKNPELGFFNAYLSYLEGDFGRADSAFKAFIVRFPSSELINDALFYMEISNLVMIVPQKEVLDIEKLLLMIKPEEAEERARAFLRKNPSSGASGYARLLLGKSLISQGKLGEAVGMLKNLKENAYDFIAARGLLSAYRIARDSLSDPEMAQDILETLILTYPNSPYADVARSLM